MKLLGKHMAYIYDVSDFEYWMTYSFLFSCFVFHNAVSVTCILRHQNEYDWDV